MDAISAVTARIVEIQTRIATLSPTHGGHRLGSTPPSPSTASAGSFAAVLDQALTSPVAQPGAVQPGTGKALVNADGVPVEYLAYGNGRVPDHALSHVAGTGGHKLWAPAARSLEALIEAARRDGVSVGVTDSYRDYDTQVDLVRRKGLYSQGGLAAPPGTSNHGWGMAVDLRLDAAAQQWMRANAARFGFVEDVPREPWHWHYVPVT